MPWVLIIIGVLLIYSADPKYVDPSLILHCYYGGGVLILAGAVLWLLTRKDNT